MGRLDIVQGAEGAEQMRSGGDRDVLDGLVLGVGQLAKKDGDGLEDARGHGHGPQRGESGRSLLTRRGVS
ncbi:hypothetical protein GCM10010274_66080 [Streptomyces lavendofoliae]|uniref:Uncharacterized protein n=1 Tax=Streptomyces lavendofoliae TaxID=67314 RepID=A0A918M8M1_9ACTN|nr:hypothetical protein GCM10010274_66080 [Streptomyces lavendofoliae]